jgi:hypothetical protein
MVTTKKSIMAIEDVYLDYGLDKDSWTKLALLSSKVESAGLKLEQAFSMKKDRKLGIECLFSTPGKHAFMLTLASRDKCLYCKVHRNMDVAASGMWKDQIQNWEHMARKMIAYH